MRYITAALLGLLLGMPDFAPAATGEYALDAVAKSCLSCHDGTSAPDAAVHASRSSLSARGTFSAAHPIGVHYPSAAFRSPQEYRSPAILRPGICLPEEKVSCISCHELAADRAAGANCQLPLLAENDNRCPASGKLTAAPRDLCLACHIK